MKPYQNLKSEKNKSITVNLDTTTTSTNDPIIKSIIVHNIQKTSVHGDIKKCYTSLYGCKNTKNFNVRHILSIEFFKQYWSIRLNNHFLNDAVMEVEKELKKLDDQTIRDINSTGNTQDFKGVVITNDTIKDRHKPINIDVFKTFEIADKIKTLEDHLSVLISKQAYCRANLFYGPRYINLASGTQIPSALQSLRAANGRLFSTRNAQPQNGRDFSEAEKKFKQARKYCEDVIFDKGTDLKELNGNIYKSVLKKIKVQEKLFDDMLKVIIGVIKKDPNREIFSGIFTRGESIELLRASDTEIEKARLQNSYKKLIETKNELMSVNPEQLEDLLSQAKFDQDELAQGLLQSIINYKLQSMQQLSGLNKEDNNNYDTSIKRNRENVQQAVPMPISLQQLLQSSSIQSSDGNVRVVFQNIELAKNFQSALLNIGFENRGMKGCPRKMEVLMVDMENSQERYAFDLTEDEYEALNPVSALPQQPPMTQFPEHPRKRGYSPSFFDDLPNAKRTRNNDDDNNNKGDDMEIEYKETKRLSK